VKGARDREEATPGPGAAVRDQERSVVALDTKP
jgi:hypothetical protein